MHSAAQLHTHIDRDKSEGREQTLRVKTSQRIRFLWIPHEEKNVALSSGKSRKQIYNHIVVLLTLSVTHKGWSLLAAWCSMQSMHS